MMRQCHGCEGRGWVDSQYAGPTVCPICGGTGRLEDNFQEGGNRLKVPPNMPTQGYGNKNPLLAELEQWLQQQEGVRFDHRNKTMNTYKSWSTKNFKELGLVWISTNGSKNIYLRKGDYTTADPNQSVMYETPVGKPLWGGYPQFVVYNRDDISYAKKLIEYSKRNL